MERDCLLENLHELITSPLSTSVYSDIMIKIDGGKSFWTSKLAVFLWNPYLEIALLSADMLILPPCSSKNEEEGIINVLQFNIRDTADPILDTVEDSLKSDFEEDYIVSEQRLHQNHGIVLGLEVQSLDRYPCPDCSSTFANKRDLKKHSVKHSDASYKCPLCGIRIKHKKNYNRHITLHGDNKILFKCPICDRAFNRKCHYKRHITNKQSMEDVAKSIVSILKETTAVIIENLAVHGEDSEAVTQLGGRLLDLLDDTADRIGTYDVRQDASGGESTLEARLESFFAKATTYDEERGSNNKMVLKHLQTHSKSLIRVLDADWNTGLPHFYNDHNVAEINVVTPEKKVEENLRMFSKFTPLKTERACKECPFCGKVFGIKSLANHVRDKHKEDDKEEGEKEKSNDADGDREAALGTCKMPDKKNPKVICGRRFPSDRIKRHLKEFHSYDCPKLPLRGFTSEDGGRSWSPLFMKKAEPDPDYDIMIQPLDSSPEEDEEEEEHESQTFVLEDDNRSTTPRKRLFSESVGEEASMVDKSAEADMSYEEIEVDYEKAKNTEYIQDKSFSDTEEVEDVTTGPYEDSVVQNSLEAGIFLPCEDSVIQESSEAGTFETNLNSRKDLVVNFVDEGDSPIVDLNLNLDSDCEDGDSPAFSHKRMKNKAERHDKRINLTSTKLSEKDGNKNFVTKFQEYMSNRGIQQSRDDRAGHKVFGHIFRYHDSLLTYETETRDGFFLDKLIAFKSNEYLNLKFPLEWIRSTCPENPSRAIEKLKAHKIARDFLKSELDNTDFGGSTEDILKKTLILDGIEKIGRDIQSHGLFARYDKLIKVENAEKRQARMLKNPSEANNVARAVLKWNSSEESREREAHFLKIHEEVVNGGPVKSRPFTTLGHYARFRMEIVDKNRPNSYHLLNSDIQTATKLFWPEGYSGFGDLPDGWDENVCPSPGTEPSAWSITVPGSRPGQKCGKTTYVTMVPEVKKWIEIYRDVKEKRFPNMKNSDLFFVNFSGLPLSDSADTAIWTMFQKVTGISRVNLTQIRKGAEMNIRKNAKMTDVVPVLNNHSQQVGEEVYNIGNYQTRAEYVNATAAMEGSSSQLPAASAGEQVQARRRERELEDQRFAQQKADDILSRDKQRKNQTLSSQTRVKSGQREFFQKLICNDPDLEIHQKTSKKFPVDKVWKRAFYRMIDSGTLASDDCSQARSIEEELFLNIKHEVEKESGQNWVGDEEQNRLADLKIAQCLKRSFHNFEKTSKDVHYFKF